MSQFCPFKALYAVLPAHSWQFKKAAFPSLAHTALCLDFDALGGRGGNAREGANVVQLLRVNLQATNQCARKVEMQL